MTKMPEPVVFRLDKDGNRSEGMITITQAEAWKIECVREMLMEALDICEKYRGTKYGKSAEIIGDRIRALIPKEKK